VSRETILESIKKYNPQIKDKNARFNKLWLIKIKQGKEEQSFKKNLEPKRERQRKTQHAYLQHFNHL
jgi:hypothetical protein